jgi:hypothetical protein
MTIVTTLLILGPIIVNIDILIVILLAILLILETRINNN